MWHSKQLLGIHSKDDNACATAIPDATTHADCSNNRWMRTTDINTQHTPYQSGHSRLCIVKEKLRAMHSMVPKPACPASKHKGIKKQIVQYQIDSCMQPMHATASRNSSKPDLACNQHMPKGPPLSMVDSGQLQDRTAA